MKVAVAGKGGVGKTTLSAGLAMLSAREGHRVIAVDADPDANLAATLGFPDPDGITPLSDMQELIAERTGAQPGSSSLVYTLNPEVEDVPEKFCPEHEGVRLMVMGGANRGGGSGCLCPEGAFLRALLSHLMFHRDDVVILDMEAGIEHLTRGTARAVDAMVVVVEPGARSLETASRIAALAGDLGVQRVWAVANKVRGDEDRDFIGEALGDVELVAAIPYRPEILDSSMSGAGVGAILDGVVGEQIQHLRQRLAEAGAS